MSTPSDSSPLSHLETLHPLACVLVGTEDAPDLLRHVAEQVTALPADERPNSLEEWIQRLLRTVEDAPSNAEQNAPAASPPFDASDATRREVAERILQQTLPLAFASCSRRERVALTLSVLEPSASLPSDTDAGEILWSTLATILSDPEYRIVETAVSTEGLQEALREQLVDRIPEVPGSLRTELETALTSTASQEDQDEPKAPDSWQDHLPARPTPRALLFILLLGLLVLGGGLGVSYLSFPSTSDTPQSLVAFSADRASAVTVDLVTNSPDEAENYVQAEWDRRLSLPSITDATLRGVGRLRVSDDVEIPVFVYEADGARLALFAYNYAVLRRIGTATTLPTSLRSALAKSNHFVPEPSGPGGGLLWRNRDDLFVAVAPSLPTDSLRSRLRVTD